MIDHAMPHRPPRQDTLVSVVLPVYNEAQVLPELLHRLAGALAAVGVDYEILFIDDGSNDRSPQVLDGLAEHDGRVRVVHFARNFGHQAAVQAGIVHARGDAVVLMDSDMQDAPEAVARFIEKWQAGYDVVYAVRVARKEGLLKRLLFSAFHRLMFRVASSGVPVDAGNFGLIDRRVARQIAALGERDRYFPGLRSWVGFRQTGIEIERNARYDDRPRVSFFGLVRLAKTAVFSFSRFPLIVFYAVAAVATMLLVGLSCYGLCCSLFTGLPVPGWSGQLLAVLFFGALNALGICVLGEYLVRVYDQVRGRPLYLIDRTVNMEPSGEAGDRSGDEPYMELIQEAVHLLEAGTAEEEAEPSAAAAGDVCEPVVFPLTND